MTYGFVENSTAEPLVVATFAEIDVFRIGPPTCVYTLAPGETRAVFSFGISYVQLHFGPSKIGRTLATGRHLSVQQHRSGKFDVKELDGHHFSGLHIPLLSQRDQGNKQDGPTHLVQVGDEVCTQAALLPMTDVLHHGVVLSCSPKSITVAHFQDNGVQADELFGGFTSSQVWLVDRWGTDADQQVAAPPEVTKQRIIDELDHPRRQITYNIAKFNCEHWAYRVKALNPDTDGESRQLNKFNQDRFLLQRTGILAFANHVTEGAKAFR